ncbi:MAG: alpha/beta fold hydrolase [Solirubrobacteraceae bacterium]
MLVGGGIGDNDKRTPASIIDEGPQRTVYRYLDSERRRRAVPVLLVPPLAAPATCMDLRPGCSLAEHLLAAGHATYLVDYGAIAFSDRELGLEHWVEEVLPRAARVASEDAGGQPVALVGWCLGGIMSLLAAAGDPEIPVAGVVIIASPFDFRRVRLIAPLRPVDDLLGGQLVSAAYRLLGGPHRWSGTPTRPPHSTSRSSSRGRSSPISTIATSWPRSRRWTRSWRGCTPIPGGPSASSTTASSASTSWPAGGSTWAIGRSTLPRCTSPSWWWQARATASRHRVPCSTWPICCLARRTSGSRPRRGGAPRRAHRPLGAPHHLVLPGRVPR